MSVTLNRNIFTGMACNKNITTKGHLFFSLNPHLKYNLNFVTFYIKFRCCIYHLTSSIHIVQCSSTSMNQSNTVLEKKN